MKLRIFSLILLLCGASAALAGNVNVTNPTSRPVPVQQIGGAPLSIITTTAKSGLTVTTTSSTALAANSSRLDANIVNYGATGCFLARSETAVAGQGIYLAPNGGSYNINAGNLYRGIITAITAIGTTTLAISEGQ